MYKGCKLWSSDVSSSSCPPVDSLSSRSVSWSPSELTTFCSCSSFSIRCSCPSSASTAILPRHRNGSSFLPSEVSSIRSNRGAPSASQFVKSTISYTRSFLSAWMDAIVQHNRRQNPKSMLLFLSKVISELYELRNIYQTSRQRMIPINWTMQNSMNRVLLYVQARALTFVHWMMRFCNISLQPIAKPVTQN